MRDSIQWNPALFLKFEMLLPFYGGTQILPIHTGNIL